MDSIDLARELVEGLECPSCGRTEEVLRPVENVRDDDLLCEKCQVECTPHFVHGITGDSELLDRAPRQLGLPAQDILWVRGEKSLGVELADGQPEAIWRA